MFQIRPEKRIALLIGFIAAIVAMTACNFSGGGTLPTPGSPDPFTGEAALVISTVNGNSVTLADTGPLPSTGGVLETSLLDVEVANVLTAQAGHSIVSGQGQTTNAETSLAKLDLSLPGQHIQMDFRQVRAQATCSNGTPETSGLMDIKRLTINGNVQSISTAPNQSVNLIDQNNNTVGKITFNEQDVCTSGDTSTITVIALHIVVNGSADISIGKVVAGVKCTTNPAPTEDFVTGGGFIETGGFAANFGLVAGTRNGTPFGHFVYIDEGTGLKLRASSITAYQIISDTKRHIEGTAEINQVGGSTFTLDVVDNGEPGNTDTISLNVSNGYSATGTLVGGNIQIHKP